jgi:choline dehydrogenase-like flavoprotein
MPFVMQREHAILSPYFDHLSFFFNRDWHIPAKDTLSLMIKLKDERIGHVETDRRGTIRKTLTDTDKSRLQDAVSLCQLIMERVGISPQNTFLGTVNAGHPGGMLPLTPQEAATCHSDRLPDNLYVADATLLPASLGNPPILTIIALAKRISRICRELA